jgi:hypothetical protein
VDLVDGGLAEIETEVIDLRRVPLGQLRRDRDTYERPTEDALKQVERPRFNLGSGPPGRAD